MGFDKFFSNKKAKNNLILASIWAILLIAAFMIRSVLMPFLLAALIAYVLDPLVTKISKTKVKNYFIPRWLCVIIVYIFIAIIIYIFATFFLPQMYRELIKIAKIS
ncbi:AI-2E family transporter, partial [Sulfobacillus acidophilus]|nr:AI-2E family transporter [Sulfobacillus acidophilus]